MSVSYTTYGQPGAKRIGVDDPTLVGWNDATYDFGVTARKGFIWSFLDDDKTNNGTIVSAPQALLFTPVSRGEKVIENFDPDQHILRFDLMPGYFGGDSFVKIDSSDEFTDFLELVAFGSDSKGNGDSYVTIHAGDIIVRIDSDKSWLGDLRLTFDDLAASLDLSDVVTVIDFDEFALAEGEEQSLVDLNGGSTVYKGFEWSQLGVFNPAGDSQLGYTPSSGPNTGFIGEKDNVDRPEYDGYDAPAGSPIEIYRADDFTFVSAAFNAASFLADLTELELTVRAYVDGIDEAVGELTFTVDNVGDQDVIEFGNPLDDQRFENINRLVIDGAGYFGIDDFTFV